jgi:hypothetical protein
MENEIKFPRYCCFGKLQAGSICETANEITADYQMFGSVVHKLSYSKRHDSWQIRDLSSNGSSPRLSGGKTMDKAICIHMQAIHDKKDEFLAILRKELFNLGNIWLNPLPTRGEGTHITYSPAGLLLTVRLLLTDSDELKNKLDKLKELPVKIGDNESTELSILEAYETYSIILRNDKKNEFLKTTLTEFLIPLAFVYDAAKWLFDKGMTGGNRFDRIIIENPVQELSVQGFHFMPPYSSDETGFIVITKGIFKSKEEFTSKLEIIKEKYRESD